MRVACVTEHVNHSVLPGYATGVLFLSLAIISAVGSPASLMSYVSSLLVAMSMIMGCWAVELSMMGDVARAGCLVWLDGAYLEPAVAG